jgi:plasmid maintenance system antidote protein VapI
MNRTLPQGGLTTANTDRQQSARPQKVDPILLTTCGNLLQAIHLCIHLSHLPHWKIAEKLGIDKGNWSRMMQGQSNFSTNRLPELMNIAGNYAPLQWLAMHCQFELFEDVSARRRDELERELAKLNAKNVAA